MIDITPLPDPQPRLIGQLEGRVAALEDRMDRTEAAIATRLSSIEAKLDLVATTLAQGMGGLRAVHWVGGIVLAIIGFIAAQLSRNAR